MNAQLSSGADHTGPNQAGTDHALPPPHAVGQAQSIYDLEDTLWGKAAALLHNTASLLTLPLMTLCICLEVVMRYLFNAGLRWSQEVCGISLLVLVLCCQAHCWQKDRHIRMDLLYNLAPLWFKKLSNVLTVLCGAIFFGTIAVQAMLDIPYQFAVNESTDEIHLPLWLLNCVIILSCGMLLLLLLRYIFRLFANMKGKPQ